MRFLTTRGKACLSGFCFLLLTASSALASFGGLSESFNALTLTEGAIIGATEENAIVRSSDGGLNFETLRAETAPDTLHAIAASGPVVIAGGSSGLLLRADLSVDAFAWAEVLSGTLFGSVRGIAQDGAGNWLAVVDTTAGAVVRSVDNGLNWATVANPPVLAQNAVVYNSVYGRWIAVGGDGFGAGAAYSADGLSWTAADLPLFVENLLSVAVDADGKIVAVGEQAILESVDGGVTYTEVDFPPSQTLTSVVAVSPGVFVAAGAEGIVVRIEDGEYIIIDGPNSEAPTIRSLLTDSGNVFLSSVVPLAQPEIDPNGGSFSEPVEVTISGPVGANIYYTLDGSAPTANSTLYTGSFMVTETTTVRAVSELDEVFSLGVSAVFDFADPAAPTLPALQITRTDAASFELLLSTSVNGRSHQLETSVDLQDWADLQAPQVGDGDALTWSVSLDGPRRFFRVYLSD